MSILEQDAALKTEKESLMKQLTNAYKANDLLMLLRLEIQWIHKENTHLESLSEEKLNIYNLLLKEQIQELEDEQNMLIYHPKYMPLKDFLNDYTLPNIKKLTYKKDAIKEMIESLKLSIGDLKGNDPISELRNIIHVFSTRFNDEF